jgi:hypothetical protein
MDKIRTELRNLRCVPLVHLYNSDYEWWNTITDTEERKTYITFYYKFCDTLDNIKNKLHYEYKEKEKELISKLVLDFAPYRKKRYFDPSMFPIGTIVCYDYTGERNSDGVSYCIVKATKTYLEGYSIIGTEIGEWRKFSTSPKTISYIKY